MKTKIPDHIITCVYCGQAYPENTPTHGKDVSALTEHIKRCPQHPMRVLEEELQDMRATLDMRLGADRRAVKMWQAAHPERSNVWPDHADLVVWLMERNDNLMAAVRMETKARNGKDRGRLPCKSASS